ncbi:potassium-transporting ATPase subunit A [[Clostridium] sordellii]|uniref:Potassium-transporting ATPase potassium-binding subunit n=1 Tax=Paraclostridium sordellii TaxID=1505 RepID=A0ABM9RM03_PARSO|nr:potassium-transporting ATPase subunit KdpA [Paeniclostridium sordellii]CEJ72981.1 Potassium-translocating ATPase A chain [[Clostridium] sordellii] [Paeniclostridium sordellii]CEN68534.1 potassium-transporting ATPase subunit A [[Clostridium] sordellii] [Paeniclostridium sordellii]CEN71801.1 potassium-transporting ATPase subunit A [[Clostridium] sordellii] [Paeniclostridium sordellii]CEO22370.1 potassium-transporting ATPase subunit A [[Clostridium] sordellii] [Paeniclostridium sordellii]CEP76
MSSILIQVIVFILLVLLLAKPLGIYISKVFKNEKVFLSKIIIPVEKFIYKVLKVNEKEEMNGKEYTISLISFSILSLLFVLFLQMVQYLLPLNPEKLANVRWDLAFNTAISFVTNTNWQSYSGETTLSYLSQMIGLTVQNFVSAAVGISVLMVLIRGFKRSKISKLGNFWVDLTKSTLYILLPLSFVLAIFLTTQGVVQNLKPYQEVSLVQEMTLDNGEVIDKQIIPGGPAASQIAIKQLGTNGGGFFGTNSAHPLENPTYLSNLAQVVSIILIPAALCFTFGDMMNDKKQGKVILYAMLIIFILAMSATIYFEYKSTPELVNNVSINSDISLGQSGGNMEGKETRFGVTNSSIWGVATTSASNGSVNSMHDSFTPIGGMTMMILMQLGEVIFGGVGCGLYGMLAFVILTVFISGLMVGRTPEYLGKKIEPYEMKMASILIITTPVLVLVGTSIICLLPSVNEILNNSGAHGFSEILYALSSTGNNNGSAFAGFSANNVFVNVLTGIVMLLARFIPIVLIIKIAQSLASKKIVPASSGTLATNNMLFVFLLVGVVLMIGALSFLPSLALGPIAEHLSMIF